MFSLCFFISSEQKHTKTFTVIYFSFKCLTWITFCYCLFILLIWFFNFLFNFFFSGKHLFPWQHTQTGHLYRRAGSHDTVGNQRGCSRTECYLIGCYLEERRRNRGQSVREDHRRRKRRSNKINEAVNRDTRGIQRRRSWDRAEE